MQEKHNYSSKEFKNMLKKLPNEIRVFEHGIKSSTMEQYRALAAEITLEEAEKELNFLDLDLLAEQNKDDEQRAKRKKAPKTKKLTERSLVAALKKSQNWEKTDTFKRNVVHAANTASVDVYRFLKVLVDSVPEDLKEWVYAGIMQCQMHLENNLMDEPVGFIATALGGRGYKIRYYFAVTAMDAIDERKASIILDNYKDLAEEFDIEIEETSFSSEFMVFRVLVPYTQMVTDYITSGTIAIDSLREPEFWITNVVHPTTTELQSWASAKKSQAQQ